jgi:hypothetical protein
MITYDQAYSADEFHISHAGLPCTVWHRSGVSYSMSGGGFYVPVYRNEDGTLRRDSESQWHHITGASAGDFHTADECPRALRMSDNRPPAEPVLSLSGRSEDGRDEWGFDASGYDANGYDADGYDADGYDANGYDADGDARPGSLDPGDLDLSDLWDAFTYSRFDTYGKKAAFREHLRSLVRDPDDIDSLEFCDSCGAPAWDEDLLQAQGGSVSICGSCWDEWATCDRCEDKYDPDDLYETLGGSDVCRDCRASYYSYCEDCDGYYPDEDSGDHEHGRGDGCCTSPQLGFAVRNDGDDPLANDTRVTITLPAGTIATEGLTAIRYYLKRQGLYDLSYGLDTLGDQWQTRNGNYVKRLSRHAYQAHQAKLTQEVMSQVGCIAREHSTAVSVAIEVTRDLNLPAYEFYHEDSCWWGSYGESRCTLKTNGGLGLRSFGDSGRVSGRAWVLPLRLDEHGKLVPTFDALTPDAFVVFNGYGDLEGYAAPRILAHMAGWTYRKISFSADPMYVNSGGYLVASEDIAAPYTDGSLYLSVRQHSNLFEIEKVLTHA